MKTLLLLLSFLLINFSLFSQPLFGPEDFATDNILHGTSGSTAQWFAPDYYTPIDYIASGGCTAACAGYQGNWNNYWMNFLRTPAINCVGNDTVVLSFDLSNSYFASQPNDKIYFNMWIDGGYEDAISNQTIYFDSLRNCMHFDVEYDLTPYTNLSGVLFYLNAYCGYNNSNTFSFKVDNIEISGSSGVNTSLMENNTDYFISTKKEGLNINSYSNKKQHINIFNINGQLTHSASFVNSYNLEIKSGFYIIQIFEGERKFVKKIIIP
jgi:hypothetical protein